MNHGFHHDSHQQMLLEGFYDEPFPLGYREEQINQPKAVLYGLNQRGSPDHKHTHSIYGDPHRLDREVG